MAARKGKQKGSVSMSNRKASQPVTAKPKPNLRAVPQPEPRQPAKPDADLQAMLDDMQRRYRVQRARLDRDDPESEAA